MGMEQFSVSLSKKCDRLATALYLVTNFLSDIEPLKLRLRSLSLELVRGATLVRYGTIQDESNILETITGNITETLGLFELAFINGLISEMNFSILKREYVSLREAIQVKKTSRVSRTDTLFGESFFGPTILGEGDSSFFAGTQKKETMTEFPKTDFPYENRGYSQGQSKGHSEIKDNRIPNKMSDRIADLPKDNTAENDKEHHLSFSKNTQQLESKTQNISLSIKSRRVRIIKLVKDKREVSIKDISDHFPDLSEKTIQRELVSLTESGVFKKTGARRWSRYSMSS